MDLIPGVRKKLRRRRTEKILEAGTPQKGAEGWPDLSVEGFIGKKVEYFFERLGSHEAEGLYDAVIEQVERPLIQKALIWAGGNQIRASRVLGINRNTLRSKIRRLKIRKAG